MAQQLNNAVHESLILYLLEDTYPSRGFTINISNETLQPVENSNTQWQSVNKNWTHYSTNVSGVTVPAVITATQVPKYTDYRNGVLTFSGVVPSPRATYSYNVVDVLDGWPDFDYFEDAQLPLVCVSMDNVNRNPLQLGGGYFMNRLFNLDIFARSESEKYQIAQATQDALKYNFPVLNLTQNYPLDAYGNINQSYNVANQTLEYARITDLSFRSIHTPDAHQKMMHRALITIRVETSE